MSKANEQSLCFIAAIAGCAATINGRNLYARVDLREALANTFEWTVEVLKRWPEDEKEECADCIRYIKTWALEMGIRQDKLSGATLLYMIERILTDLESRLRNKQKLKLVEGIRKCVQPVLDFVDPDKLNFIAFSEGDSMLDMLYEITQWEG